MDLAFLVQASVQYMNHALPMSAEGLVTSRMDQTGCRLALVVQRSGDLWAHAHSQAPGQGQQLPSPQGPSHSEK